MASSVESRVPFLDYRLVEFIVSLPEEFKIKDGLTKWIFRESLGQILPQKILNRYDKMGFVTPETFWMKENIGVFKNEFFSACKGLSQFVNIHKVKSFIDSYSFDNDMTNSIIWRIVCLGRWLKVFYVTTRETH